MGDEQSKLLLLGVGGGGGRLAAAVRALYEGDMRALCMDTDALANREVQQAAPGIPCVIFGTRRLAGNGTGGSYAVGIEAFKDDGAALLEDHLPGVRTVVMITCLGAGTGSGAASEIARLLEKKGIPTLCVATLPFGFEGGARQAVADCRVPPIKEHVSSFAAVPLDDLFDAAGQGGPVMSANEAANDVLASGLALLWRIVSHPGLLCIDPERLYGLIVRGGSVRFGSEVASGEHRVGRLLDLLGRNRLLRGKGTLGKANAVLVGILGGADLRLAEIREIMDILRGWCRKDCRIEMGTVLDPAFDGRIELVVFAFENWMLPVAAAPDAVGGGAPEAPPVVDPSLLTLSVSGKRGKKTAGSKLSFGLTGRGKFQNVEPTLSEDGEDLDTPTFYRRKLPLDG